MAHAMADLFDCGAATASYHHADFTLEELVTVKGSRRVVVCIPARDEEATIGSIVSTVRALSQPANEEADEKGRLSGTPLVDEILVVDDRSSDGTAEAAAGAGAVVLEGPGLGKGEAMGLARGRGDIIVYLDGDVLNFAAHYVTGLLGPMLLRPGTVMVKGRYARPAPVTALRRFTSLTDLELPAASDSLPRAASVACAAADGGGRVTELVAKPLLSLLYPELAWLAQPLAGETALRGEVLEGLELAPAYGVEIGLLIDVWSRYGAGAIAEVELGERLHRNRPLLELAPEALDVLTAALTRSGLGDRLVPLRTRLRSRAHWPSAGPPAAGRERL